MPFTGATDAHDAETGDTIMSKRIALFLDGTWNDVNSDTNVWRMKSLCTSGADQVVYYSSGVGTQFGQRISGGMFGYGLDDEVIHAYQWLVEQFVENDRIYLFGFSRGAFTARSLSGLIAKCGLLKPGAPISLPQLYARYKKGHAVPTIRGLKHVADAQLTHEDKWLTKYSMAIPIWLVGVWDTVGALGVPFGHIPVISRSNYGFLDTDLMIENDRAFHAMAIDEHREAFAPTLWTKTAPRNARPEDSPAPRPVNDVEQRWFVGAHADVGGGYEDGILAQIPLDWLMAKAGAHGLTFKDKVVLDGTESTGTNHDSFAEMAGGLYKLIELGKPYYRLIGAPPVAEANTITTTINETIDASVFDRWRRDASYRPRNLSDWAQAHDVADVARLEAPVFANDPTVVVQEAAPMPARAPAVATPATAPAI
jgi:uncharacterized protein (DUF2235 family)